MAKLPSALDACRKDLFTSEAELREKYTPSMAEKVLRLREMYNLWLTNPAMKDRQLRDALMSRYKLSQSAAYEYISVIHQLVPLLATKSQEFHLARGNEMLLETYAMAKARKDTKTMAATAASYLKYNKVEEQEFAIPYEEMIPQPFCATYDVRTLGIKPIPDYYNYVRKLTKDLMKDFPDIVDVEAEEIDLEEKFLFADGPAESSKS